MKFEEWEKFYSKIVEDFGFSPEEDRKAGELLLNLLRGEQRVDKSVVESLIYGKRVNIFGAAPSLEDVKSLPEGISIVCDGATTYFFERGWLPDIIVTDLDGIVEHQIACSQKGSLAVVHAHGDNTEALKMYIHRFKRVLPTVQVEPFPGVYNFGGFTDGDRAVCLAEHFKAREIVLYGFDFHGGIGRYSFTKNEKVKRKKLLWAERIVNYLIEKGANIRFVE